MSDKLTVNQDHAKEVSVHRMNCININKLHWISLSFILTVT